MKTLSNGHTYFASWYEAMGYALMNLVYGRNDLSEALADEVLGFVYIKSDDEDSYEYSRQVQYLEKLYEHKADVMDCMNLRIIQLCETFDEYLYTNGDIRYPSPYLIGLLASGNVEEALEYLANEGMFEYVRDEDGNMIVIERDDAYDEYYGDDEEDDEAEESEEWVEKLVTPVEDDFDRDPDTGEVFDPNRKEDTDVQGD